jgi:hypothetical protein
MECETVDSISDIDERVKWQALVITVMKLRGPEREGISRQAKNSAS